jgi:hypothetical protein
MTPPALSSLRGLRAVLLGGIEVFSCAEENPSIREKVRVLGLDRSEAAGLSRRQWYRPQRKHEGVARSAQQR